jgi:hypothetical protein
LHDIGKLAIPEHIISKPGRLTPEEFEKMKIHPMVGAEILERVQFPYPVVPIVRAHHEKFDGTGYPLGLRGSEIPIGARILSAVDFLDALASDRQYRRALPLHEAMARLVDESGKAFDPQVVRVLERRYVELEQLVHLRTDRLGKHKLSTEVKDEGAKDEPSIKPAAGFEAQGTAAIAGAQFSEFDRGGAPGSADSFRTQPGSGSFAQSGRNALGVCGEAAPGVPYDAIAIYIARAMNLCRNM